MRYPGILLLTHLKFATKVRRPYDISNALASMEFIEKIHHTENKKPGFRWLGLNGKPDDGSADSLVLIDPRMRVFGTDLTNTTIQKFRVDGYALQVLKPHMPMPMLVKQDSLENENERIKTRVKGYQFGPFAPSNVTKVRASHDGKGKQVVDWESLAPTYRPQYQNQALKDHFSHYVEAWNSWYSEVAGKWA